MQEGTLEILLHWEQRGLGPSPILHHHGLQDVQTRFFVSFCSLLSTFQETSHSTLFHCCSNGPSCGLGLPSHLGQGHRKEGYSIQEGSAHGHGKLVHCTTRGGSYKLKVKQFDVDDFVYIQQQPNDILDTSSGRTILRIKAIRPSSVLELQRIYECTIRDHSKNYAPCHLSNLDPTIITSTWIPPLDYPCQVCQGTNNANQMLFCNNCNGGYPLFCLKSELTQVPADIWYCSSCSPIAP